MLPTPNERAIPSPRAGPRHYRSRPTALEKYDGRAWWWTNFESDYVRCRQHVGFSRLGSREWKFALCRELHADPPQSISRRSARLVASRGRAAGHRVQLRADNGSARLLLPGV